MNPSLFLTATIGLIDSIAALALAIFLIKRWKNSTLPMRAYAIFWCLTVFTWLPQAIRYYLISFGVESSSVMNIDFIVQASLYASGIPLFYFICSGQRRFSRALVSHLLAIPSAILGVISLWMIMQPGGLFPQQATTFSVENTPSAIPLMIFNIQAVIIVLLLVYGCIKKYREYKKGVLKHPYGIFYPLIILIYLGVGMLDQSAIVTGSMLILLRSFYAASFLTVYIIIIQHTAAKEKYLVGENPII